MSLLPSNPLINYAQQCMIGSIEQRRVFNEEPMFVKQLEVIEVNNDDDVLEAIKHKFQAEENRHRWIFDDIVGEKELEEYEAQSVRISSQEVRILTSPQGYPFAKVRTLANISANE